MFHATYPCGAQDAEALLITPDGRLFVVTKGTNAPVALYAFPRELRPGGTVRLERIGQPRDREKVDKRQRITDGAVSPDGRWIVLRTTGYLAFYHATNLLSGDWREASRVDLQALGEPQGEGVTFGPGNDVFLVSEGGKRSARNIRPSGVQVASPFLVADDFFRRRSAPSVRCRTLSSPPPSGALTCCSPFGSSHYSSAKLRLRL